MEISKKLVQDVNRIVNESKGSEVEKFRRRYEKYSVEELKKEKAKLEKEIRNSEVWGYEYDSLEWQIDAIDMFINERKKAKVNL